MQGDVVTLQDIFLYAQKDVDKNGKIIGEHQATGFIPKFIEKLEKMGYNIPRGIFSNNHAGVTAPPRKPVGEQKSCAPRGAKATTKW